MPVGNWIHKRIKVKCWQIRILCLDVHDWWMMIPIKTMACFWLKFNVYITVQYSFGNDEESQGLISGYPGGMSPHKFVKTLVYFHHFSQDWTSTSTGHPDDLLAKSLATVLVAWWLGCWTLGWRGLVRVFVLCSWAREFTLTMPQNEPEQMQGQSMAN